MYIKRVELDGLSHDTAHNISRAALRLVTQEGTVILDCKVQHPPGTSHQDIVQLMLDNAIAQLQRMPEYRAGHRHIELAADALEAQAKPTSNNA